MKPEYSDCWNSQPEHGCLKQWGCLVQVQRFSLRGEEGSPMKAAASICFAGSSAIRNLQKKKEVIMNGCCVLRFICLHLTSIIKASLLALRREVLFLQLVRFLQENSVLAQRLTCNVVFCRHLIDKSECRALGPVPSQALCRALAWQAAQHHTAVHSLSGQKDGRKNQEKKEKRNSGVEITLT